MRTDGFNRTGVLLVLLAFCSTLGLEAQERWWLDKPVRLIQTNLREIDARDFDVDVYMEKLAEYGANTVLINVGGIVANYPTELEFHYRNPNLQFDMIGEVVRLRPRGAVRSVRLLRARTAVDFEEDADGRIRFTVPELEDFEIAVME